MSADYSTESRRFILALVNSLIMSTTIMPHYSAAGWRHFPLPPSFFLLSPFSFSSLLPPPSYQIRIFNEPVSKYSTSNRPVLPPFLSTSRKKKKPVPLLLDVIDIYFFFSWILLIIIKWACISLIRNRLVTELLPKINPAIIFRVARLFLSKPVLKLMELLI